MDDEFALCTVQGHMSIKSFTAGITWTRDFSFPAKSERVLMIFQSKTSSILNVGKPPYNASRMSSKVTLYTIVEPIIWISFFFEN